jgi:hypothetical protein
MSEDNSNLRDDLVNDKVSDEEIANLDEAKKAKEVAKGTGVDEVDKAANAAPKAKPLPKTKAGMIKAAYDKMHSMNKDDLAKTVEKMMYEAKEKEGDDEEDMEDGDSEMSKTNEKYGKKKKANEKYKKDHSMKEDIQALVDSEATLSEGFKEKAETIFEAALNAKVGERIEELEENYQEELAEETDRIQSELVEKVDGYLNYVIENWMEDNKLAIENGLRAEIAESFMGALKGVFQEHYVEVPESKVDVVDELAGKVDRLEDELNESVTRAMTLKEQVQSLTREKIVNEAADDLTVAQAEKLRGLTEGIDFENEETFEEKVATIKESYFGEDTRTSSSNTASTMFEETGIDADVAEDQDENLSGPMAQYVAALKRANK